MQEHKHCKQCSKIITDKYEEWTIDNSTEHGHNTTVLGFSFWGIGICRDCLLREYLYGTYKKNCRIVQHY